MENFKFRKGKNSGITLIALIITIIVLLILAGVTINAISGSESAPAKANEAGQKNDIGAAKDDISLTVVNAKMQGMETAYVGNGVSASEASTTVGTEVIKAVAQKYQTNNQIGKATIEIDGFGTIENITENATVTVYTTDFEVIGTITLEDGVLTWGEILPNVPSIRITADGPTIIAKNGTVQLSVEFRKMSATTLTWSSTDTDVATVNDSGLVTVVSETSGATANITAIGNGVTSNEITITVQDLPKVSKYKTLTANSQTGIVAVVDSSTKTTLYDDNNKEISIPAGFGIASDSSTTIAGGIVIEDTSGNQYVWVDVPKTKDVVYSEIILAYDLDNLTGTDLDNAYTAIEDAMKTYATSYRQSGYSDTYNSSMGTIGNITGASDYNTEKRKMLKSVFENGGFYVGRFEAGIEISTARTSETDAIADSLVPLSKANVAPLNFVTCSQAQTLANKVAPSEYTSGLMFGIQWDLMLKYLEVNTSLTTTDITSNSTSWGNYENISFSVNSMAKGYNTSLKKYEDIASDSKSGIILLTTGATLGASSNNNRNSKANIHDIAGNASEWTLEYTGQSKPFCCRGLNYCDRDASRYWASHHVRGSSWAGGGFRVTLY